MEPRTPITFTDEVTIEEVLDLLDRGVPLAEVERAATAASIDVRAIIAIVNFLAAAREGIEPPAKLLEAIVRGAPDLPPAPRKKQPFAGARWLRIAAAPALGFALALLLILAPDGTFRSTKEQSGVSLRAPESQPEGSANSFSAPPPVLDALVVQSLDDVDTVNLAIAEGERSTIELASRDAAGAETEGSITTHVSF